MSWYRPARAMRRALSGRLCPVCPNRLHPQDIVAWGDLDRPLYMHAECALQLVAEAERAASGAEEDAPEAASDGEQLSRSNPNPDLTTNTPEEAL